MPMTHTLQQRGNLVCNLPLACFLVASHVDQAHLTLLLFHDASSLVCNVATVQFLCADCYGLPLRNLVLEGLHVCAACF